MNDAHIIQLQRTEYPDSLEFGEAKNRLKVYFDASKLEEAKLRIANAKEIQRYATFDATPQA